MDGYSRYEEDTPPAPAHGMTTPPEGALESELSSAGTANPPNGTAIFESGAPLDTLALGPTTRSGRPRTTIFSQETEPRYTGAQAHGGGTLLQ
jgi:hypothetical protein